MHENIPENVIGSTALNTYNVFVSFATEPNEDSIRICLCPDIYDKTM